MCLITQPLMKLRSFVAIIIVKKVDKAQTLNPKS
jgi:hypothetical protein